MRRRRKWIADEIIWAGDDEVGFHTSPRTIIRGTNDGPSRYGPATGRKVDVLVFANCVALENESFLEHVIYNTSSMLNQLGFDIGDMARKLAADPPAGWPRAASVWDEQRSAARPQAPLSIGEPLAGFDVDRFVRANFDALWNRRDFAALTGAYEPNFAFQGPTDRAFRGIVAYCDLLASLFAAFPDLELQVDEVYWMGNEVEGFLVSVRWRAAGTHAGSGIYGPPTSLPVQIWGITQQQIVNERIVAEWMLFNELDVMMQLAAGRGT